MTIKELKEELDKYPDDLEVTYKCSELNCTCDDSSEYCYCGYNEYIFSINCINVNEVYNNKNKKQELRSIVLSGDRN